MSTIAQRITHAINTGNDLNSCNTVITHKPNGDFTMTLHGNYIAKREAGKLYVRWANWVTNTTRDRINLVTSDRLNIKQGKPHLNGEPCSHSDWLEVNE